MTAFVEPFNFIKAPLRNRVRVDLDAPLAQVWALVGNLARLSDYGSGLERVEAKTDARGNCTEYTCYFKPMQPGEPGIESRDIVLWYQPNHGWASHGATPDAFGLADDLHLLVVESSTKGTLLTMDAYYQAQDLAMLKQHLYEAHSDIAQNLIKRFGGRLIHCYVCE